ncbi:hypothetical protein [Pelomonas sp. Root1217]|uniref:hypothetical protein n=1 Tax=Pelomonas sp. Root1217 TaxID=1736430 RepID=UPI0012F7F648|nr:hypothetical protein [Pelomonas sp. Root1217]
MKTNLLVCILFQLCALATANAQNAQEKISSLAEATMTVGRAINKGEESLIEGELKRIGFSCDQQPIAYVHCVKPLPEGVIHSEVHEIYDRHRRRRTARVIFNQNFSDCSAFGSLRASFMEGVVPLPQALELKPPLVERASEYPQLRKEENWSYESADKPGRYLISVTQRFVSSSEVSCQVNVLIQSF